MEYVDRNYYTALFHIRNSIDDPHFKRLVEDIQLKAWYLSGRIHYKLGLSDEAIDWFDRCLRQDRYAVDPINLYLSDIYGRQLRDFERARWYFSRIEWKELNFQEKELYTLLSDTILWDQIDTSRLGYGDPNISAMLLDRDYIYIGLWNGGLLVYNHVFERSELMMPPVIAGENVRALYGDDRYIYVGTTDGLTLFDKRTGEWQTVPGVGDDAITSIGDYGDGVVIGTTGSRQYLFDRKSKSLESFPKKSLYHIVKIYYADDTTWIATRSQGVFSWDGDQLRQLPGYGRPTVPVTDMVKAGDQLWMTTFGQGVYRYSIRDRQYYRYSTVTGDIGEDFCLSLAYHDKRIYCGTLGRGIYSYNERTGAWHDWDIPDRWLVTDVQAMLFEGNHFYIGTLGNGVLRKFIIRR
jgi:hypothetical protein